MPISKTLDVLLVLIMLAGAAWTFGQKYQAEAVEHQIALLDRKIALEKETIQLLDADLPRAAMSSEKEESLEKLFSTRPATKVPAPRRRVSSPSSTSPSIALRTVMREMLYSVARSRSAGIASPWVRTLLPIASRISCWSWR